MNTRQVYIFTRQSSFLQDSKVFVMCFDGIDHDTCVQFYLFLLQLLFVDCNLLNGITTENAPSIFIVMRVLVE